MKHLLLAAILVLPGLAGAQITIGQSDMPDPGDSITVSVQTSLSGFNPAATGTNQTWDYSTLVPDSQRYEVYLSPLSTPYPYYAFSASYGVRNPSPDAIPFSLLGTPPENAFIFYKESGSTYQIPGEGVTLSGQPLPLFYNSPDVVYRFPLNYSNRDSSLSGYGMALPGFGYFGKDQKRTNNVDGWGTLILPSGTYETVRVHSILEVTDTIFLDTLGFGFRIPMPTEHEYKWLAKGGKIPVLQINTQELPFGGIQTVTEVIYQDSSYMKFYATAIVNPACPNENNGNAEVIAAAGKTPYSYLWSNGATTRQIDNLGTGPYTVTITDAYGQERTDSVYVDERTGDLACLNIPTAFTPNSDGFNDTWVIRNIDDFPGTKVEIFNRQGSVMFSSDNYTKPWDGRYKEGRVPPGVYYYFITLSNGQQFQGTVTVLR
ncbi:MAG: gliding motility-associated C-terminal domain-containing protein [Flavobacteriales bacterium]|nr:gliding motility-associated C-terminal domain-containing protein [Flavobacteriales bacterium]MCB9447914.1 gliding motility-associated C-terminal domain-containing protein [Flavobacteriales bacterium]